MNRRKLFAALGAMPLIAIARPAASRPTSIHHLDLDKLNQRLDYVMEPHPPLASSDKAAIDAMSLDQLDENVRRVWARARLMSLAGRCNAAYTMASCRSQKYVDVSFIRSLLPRINEGHRADVYEFTTPIMEYGLSRLGHHADKIAPFQVVEYHAVSRALHGTRTPSYFQFRIPQYDKLGRQYPIYMDGIGP